MFRALTLFRPLTALIAAIALVAVALIAPARAAAPAADKAGKAAAPSAKAAPGPAAGQKQSGQAAGQGSEQATGQPADEKKRANLPPGLFTSTLPSVPGRAVRESLGFHCQVFPYASSEEYLAKMGQAMAAIQEKGKAMGANGFINLSIASAPLSGKAAPGRPQKTVQGVPVPAEMLDGPPPADVIIHICGDFVRYE